MSDPSVIELPSGKPQKIGILGAGMAGLAAAEALVKAGHKVVILEAQNRAGGRVHTLRESSERHYQQWPGGGMMIPIPLPGNNGMIQIPIPQMSFPFPNFPGQSPDYQPSRRGRPNQMPNADNEDGGPIPGYGMISFQGTPCRVPLQNLPLHIYSLDPNMEEVARRSADVWNRAAHHFLPKNLIQIDHGPSLGAISIDWSGQDMPQGAAGVTEMNGNAREVEITGITIKPTNVSELTLTEVVAHEMGHALGLDHSQDRDDIMYRSVHRRPPSYQVGLSERDYQMINWLYTRQEAVPIVALR